MTHHGLVAFAPVRGPSWHQPRHCFAEANGLTAGRETHRRIIQQMSPTRDGRIKGVPPRFPVVDHMVAPFPKAGRNFTWTSNTNEISHVIPSVNLEWMVLPCRCATSMISHHQRRGRDCKQRPSWVRSSLVCCRWKALVPHYITRFHTKKK